MSSPAGTPRTPISPNGPGSGTILAVTHNECFRSFLRFLTASEKPDDKALLDLHIPHGTDMTAPIVNTEFAIIRVWWEDVGFGKLEPKGRLEGWGLRDHLLKDDD